MQNLDQIRAAAALAAADLTSRQAVSKLPAMILQNGLLAALAFATEVKDSGQPKRPEMKSAVDATADHLSNPALGIPILSGKTNASALGKGLSDQSATSLDLQRATTEALAFLSFLKRFTVKEGNAS